MSTLLIYGQSFLEVSSVWNVQSEMIVAYSHVAMASLNTWSWIPEQHTLTCHLGGIERRSWISLQHYTVLLGSGAYTFDQEPES